MDEGTGSAGKRAPRLAPAVLLVLGLWLVLWQIDGVLVSLQSEGHGGYGANDLGPLSPKDLEDRVTDLLGVWNASQPLVSDAFRIYTGVDFLFIAAYVWLVRCLVDRLPGARPAERWVLVTALADAVENLLRYLMVDDGSPPAALIWAAWLATTVKWLGLACVVLFIVGAWREVGWARGPGELTAARRAALWRMRAPLVLLSVWGAALILDPTGQVPDTFRRWLDGPDRLATAVLTAAAAVLLGLVVWTTSRRAILAEYVVTTRRPSALRWVVMSGLLSLVAWQAGWRNLLGFVVLVAGVFVLEAFARGLGLGEDPVAGQKYLAGAPKADERKEVRAVAGGLAVLPAVAVLLALAAAWARPAVVLLSGDDDTFRGVVAAILTPLAVIGAVLLAYLRPVHQPFDEDADPPGRPGRSVRVLGRSVRVWPDGLEIRHAVLVGACLVVYAVSVAWPLDVPTFAGVVAMTAIALATFVAALGEGQRYGDTHRPTRGMSMLGLKAIPVSAMLVLAFLLASQFDDGTHHAVARVGADARPAPVTPTQLFDRWKARNGADRESPDCTLPMLLVASQGGGIRAAYWTASVLDDLFEASSLPADGRTCPRPRPFDRVLALAGASGGSLGITSFAGHPQEPETSPPWYRQAWGDTDLAAVPTTWGLLVDVPQALVGFDAPDRARRLEEVWEREDPSLTEDFFAAQDGGRRPVLLLGSTQSESGCRLNVSPLRLTPRPVALRKQAAPTGNCASLLDRSAIVQDGSLRVPSAALTSDVLDYVCKGERSLARSTAALLSARFPYVTPSGGMSNCETQRATALVDGGYAENTGLQPALSAWAAVEPLVAEHNARGSGARILPILLEIDNHYAKAARSGTVGRTHELFIPPLTKGRPDALDDRGLQQQAAAEFSLALPGLPETRCRIGELVSRRYLRVAPSLSPGIPAPLAWTLSDVAMDELDRQRAAAFAAGTPADELRRLLRGATPDCD